MSAPSLRAFITSRPRLKRAMLGAMRVLSPLLHSPIGAALRYPAFLSDYRAFRRAAPPGTAFEPYPCLFDRSATTGIDAHYFHQAVWAARHIHASGTTTHVDIGSQVLFVGMLTAFTDVTFVDIRPVELALERYRGLHGSITALPFEDASVASLSCLHVMEHIGLGRYGDPIDPDGARKAAAEIARVLAPGGRALLSTPIGSARVQFNGQRVFAAGQFLSMFGGLVLSEFCLVDARGEFRTGVDPSEPDLREAGTGADCGLGLFVLEKPAP